MSTTLEKAMNGAAAPKVNDHPTIVRIQAKADEFAKAMPSVMTKDRFMRIAIGAIRKNPKLLDCDPLSLMGSLLVAAQLGFEVNTPLGHFFLIPRWNKNTNRFEADGQIGYKGWFDLVARSGRFVSMVAEPVHEKDHFIYRLGDDPLIEHAPVLADRGRAYAYYVSVRVKDGGIFRKVLTRDDVEKYRRRSQSPNSPAWLNDFDAMALKTTFLRIVPWLPKSTEMLQAEAFENTIEAQGKIVYREKQGQIDFVIPEPEPEPEAEPEPEPEGETDPDPEPPRQSAEPKPASKAPRKRITAPAKPAPQPAAQAAEAAPFDDHPPHDARPREQAAPSPLGAAVKAIEAWAIEAAAKHDAEGLPDLADKTELMQRIYEVMTRMGILPQGLKGFFTQVNALAKIGIESGYDPVSYMEEANSVVREEYLGVPAEEGPAPEAAPAKPAPPPAAPAKPRETHAEKAAKIEKFFEEAAAEMARLGHRSLTMPSALVAAVHDSAQKAGLIKGEATGYRTRLLEITDIPGSGHDVIQEMKLFCNALSKELGKPEPGSDG